MSETPVLNKLKHKLSLMGYSVRMEDGYLLVSKPNKSITKQDIKSHLRGEFNKLNVEGITGSRYDYIKISEA